MEVEGGEEPQTAGLSERCAAARPFSLTPEGRDLLALEPGDFLVHGKTVSFSPRALLCLRDTNPFRYGLVWIITSWLFENFILVLIIANTVMIACIDYSVIDRDTLDPVPNGVSTSPPYDSAYSWMNQLQLIVDPIFTVLFIAELVIKVPAMGFVWGRGTYLSNGWNCLDAVVVAAGIVGFVQIPGAPSISVLRAVRVIRPLKSLTAIPRLRALVGAILAAVPDLMAVAAVVLLMFTIFGILGLDLFGGAGHFRCRLTEFPVQMPNALVAQFNAEAAAYAGGDAMGALLRQAIANRTAHPQCADAMGAAIAAGSTDWNAATSPWEEARACVWPIDAAVERTCNDNGPTRQPNGQHVFTCTATEAGHEIGAEWPTYCGSNYDDYGNPRFSDRENVQSGIWYEGGNWGCTTFDNIFAAFLTIFQCVSLEGWTDIMYNLMDTFGWASTAAMFTSLIFIGGYFLLNLTLAVMGDRFKNELAEDEDEDGEEKLEKDGETHSAAAQPSDVPLPPPETAMQKAFGCVKRWWTAPMVDPETGKGIVWCKICGPLHWVVSSFGFRMFINLLIVLNTLVLALDSYPVDPVLQLVLEYSNFVLTICFVVELVLKVAGLGFRQYVKDLFNDFDAFIVIASLIEMVLAPPSFFNLASNGQALGGLGALRTFRVFRLLKLARSWQALQDLLVAIVRSMVSGVYFIILIGLFMLIFTLVGQQFFANRFYFNAVTHYSVSFDDVAKGTVEVYRPRSNFDSGFRSAASVFQVMSGENWNTIMYDAMRSSMTLDSTWAWNSWAAAVYFVVLVVVGTFVLLDFFIAILLNDFQQVDEQAHRIHDNDVKPPNFVRTALEGAKSLFSRCSKKDASNEAGVESDAEAVEPVEESSGAAKDAGRPSPIRRLSSWGVQKGADTTTAAAALLIQSLFRGFKARQRMRLLEEVILVEPPPPLRLRGKSLFMCRGNDGDDEPLCPRKYIGAFVTYSLADLPCFRFGKGDSVMVVSKLDEFNVGSKRGIIVGIRRDIDPRDPEDGEIVKFDIEFTSWRKLEIEPVMKRMMRSGVDSLDMAGLRVELPNMCDKDLQNLMTTYDVDGSMSLSMVELEACLEAETGEIHSGVRRDYITKRIGSELIELLTAVSFDSFIMICIIGSSVLMALDNPLTDPDSSLPIIIASIEVVVNIIFTVEAILKSIAWGFLLGKGAYLRDAWNVLDFVVLLISWITMALSTISQLKSLKSLRLLRVFRVLRAINKLPGLKAVTNGLLKSFLPLVTVVPVILLIFTIFAILFMDQLKGALSACDVTSLTAAQQDLVMNPLEYGALNSTHQAWAAGDYSGVTSKGVCEWFGADWEPVVDQSFDNIFLALATLIQLSTTEAWIDVALAAVDSRGMDMQPKEGSNEIWLVVFMVFEAVGAFFLVNLFIGVLLVQFERVKKESDKEGGAHQSSLLSEGQQKWLNERTAMEKKLLPKKRLQELRPKLPSQLYIYRLVTEKLPWSGITFEQVISACIILNTLALGIEFFGQPAWYTVVLTVINWIFAIIFTLESIIKILAFGLVGYLRDAWHVFDFSVVIATLLSFVVGLAYPGLRMGSAITILRVLRLGRIFRLIQGARAVRVIFDTMISSAPALINIVLLLSLVLFIFTIVAMQLFSKIAMPDGGALNEHANFRSFWTSMLTLIRAGTGEGWPDFVYALGSTGDGCVNDPEYDANVCGFSDPQFKRGCIPLNGCGDPYIANAYWYTFQLVIGAIMLNLMVFYIIEAFEQSSRRENGLDPVEEDAVIAHWLLFDADCNGVIEEHVLVDVLQTLQQPLGFKYVTQRGDSHVRRQRVLPEVLQAKIKLMKIPSHQQNTLVLYRLADVVVALGIRLQKFKESPLSIDEFESAELDSLYVKELDPQQEWVQSIDSKLKLDDVPSGMEREKRGENPQEEWHSHTPKGPPGSPPIGSTTVI